MLILLFIYLKTSSRDLKRLNNFLFLAVAVNLLLELVLFSKNVITHAEQKNYLADPDFSIAKNYTPCRDCNQPDIFYIIFDEYASSGSLKKYFNYSNTILDGYLEKNNFFVSKKSKSNYGFTSFSMASILEMQYLTLPPGYKEAVAKDIGRGEYTIMNNNTVKVFEKQGYNIHNHSIFDFKNHPTLLGKYFYQLRGMFIDDETLFGRVKRDIGWNISKFISGGSGEKKGNENLTKKINLLVESKDIAFSLAKDAIKNQDPAAKDFFYFHFVLPHDPFIFDSAGNVKYYQDYGSNLKEKYIDQLKYTNTLLIDLVDFIQKQYNKKAVIILQGDHGFKQWPGDPDFRNMAFQNLNATYLPDTTYTNYYDGVSSVNTFRLLFNHYFNANLPLLPDKSIEVFIKPSLKKNYGIRQDNK